MEDGTKAKKTIFIGGIGDDVDETSIYEHFATFGDIVEVQLPPAPTSHHQQTAVKHRGFAFVTYGSPADAQDAIDNMDLNELKGKVIKVNLAKPMKAPLQGGGNRAVWESEEWLQRNVKPLSQSGGVQARTGKPGQEDSEDQPADEPMED